MTDVSRADIYQQLTLELDDIMAQLQDEATSIDQSLQLYERGVKITKQLSDYLTKAQNKLTKINARLEDN